MKTPAPRRFRFEEGCEYLRRTRLFARCSYERIRQHIRAVIPCADALFADNTGGGRARRQSQVRAGGGALTGALTFCARGFQGLVV